MASTVNGSTFELRNAAMLYEFKDGLDKYLQAAGSPHASLAALIDWNKATAAQAQ